MDTLNLISCRMCLTVPTDEALTFSIFDTFKGKLLHTLIEQLFSIQITREDHLLTICLDCVNRINTVQKIHQQFIETNEKLKLLLERFKEDSQEVELLVIDDIQLLEEEASLLKKPDVEIEVISIKSEVEVTSSEYVEEDIKDVADEAHFDYQVDMINSSEHVRDNQDNVLGQLPEMIDFDLLKSEKVNVRQIRRKTIKKQKPDLPKYKCYFCKISFGTEMAFTKHLHVHFGEVPLTCVKCDNIVIRSVRQASKHLALHDEEERPHKCRICDLRFFTRENSLTHERKIHRMKVKIQQNIDGYAERRKLKKYQCSFCGQLAPNSEYLRKHELTHGPSQPVHTCEICQKQFTARKNLTRHIMIHTGELPYKCEYCDRAFRQAGDLKDHVRGHTKEKPYMCSSCGAHFRNISMLHVHRKKNNSACAETVVLKQDYDG